MTISVSWANTLSIPYTGGFQTGTFDMRGTTAVNPDSLQMTWNYPDTVVIGGQFRLTLFLEESSGQYPFRRGFWLVPKGDNSLSGFGSGQDTVWQSNTNFPEFLAPLDSNYRGLDPLNPDYPSNLNDTVRGFRFGNRLRLQPGTESFEVREGYHRNLYFRSVSPGVVLYGKLRIQAYTIYTQKQVTAEGAGSVLQCATYSYALFDSSNVNIVSIRSLSRGAQATTRRPSLAWSQKDGLVLRDFRGIQYNLRGEHLGPSQSTAVPSKE